MARTRDPSAARSFIISPTGREGEPLGLWPHNVEPWPRVGQLVAHFDAPHEIATVLKFDGLLDVDMLGRECSHAEFCDLPRAAEGCRLAACLEGCVRWTG